MFKKVRNYAAQKRKIRVLSLDTLQKVNSIVTTVSELTDMLSSMAESIDSDEIKHLTEAMDKLVNSPEMASN
ncbi:MAG: hypothetical protein J5979_04135 [Lachnospiraceae bacterium]|nr:hypothetical protein [Lachnospiraceae bacterium]